MKRITRISTWILSSLLVLLGFGGCKSSKKAVKDESLTNEDTVRTTKRPIVVRPDEPGRMRVLYAAPPVQYRNLQSK